MIKVAAKKTKDDTESVIKEAAKKTMRPSDPERQFVGSDLYLEYDVGMSAAAVPPGP